MKPTSKEKYLALRKYINLHQRSIPRSRRTFKKHPSYVVDYSTVFFLAGLETLTQRHNVFLNTQSSGFAGLSAFTQNSLFRPQSSLGEVVTFFHRPTCSLVERRFPYKNPLP